MFFILIFLEIIYPNLRKFCYWWLNYWSRI